jgi:hypothetical protein
MLTFQVSRGQRSRWILQKLDPRIWDLLLGKESGNERDFVLPERFHDYLKWPPEQLRIVSSTDIDWRPSLNAAKKLQHCHQNEAMKYECNQNNCFMGKYCKNRFIGNLSSRFPSMPRLKRFKLSQPSPGYEELFNNLEVCL